MINSIPSDIQERIDAQLASGAFSSEVEVLREAMDGLERRQRGLAQLRSMLAVAEEDAASGRFGTFEREDIKRDVRERLARIGIRE